MYLSKLFMYFAIFFFSPAALANEAAGQLDLTDSWYGVIAVMVFIIAYGLVIGEEFLHLRKSKPVLGMMTGMGILQFYGYRIRMYERQSYSTIEEQVFQTAEIDTDKDWLARHFKLKRKPFDIFISMKRAEWDTLMFFYGVVLLVPWVISVCYQRPCTRVWVLPGRRYW